MPNSTTSRLSALLCAVALLAPIATPFGDNDGGLDLPGPHGAAPSGGSDNNTSNSSSQGASGDTGPASNSVADTQVLTIVGETVDSGLRDDAGSLLVVGALLGESASLGTSLPGNDLQLGGDSAAASQVGADVGLQGSLIVPAALVDSALMLPPAVASASAALIVIDSDADADLGDLLAGQVLLDTWHATGVPAALDVGHFASLTGKLGPGLHVSFVIASVDASGELHLSALRVDTTDGQVEYASY